MGVLAKSFSESWNSGTISASKWNSYAGVQASVNTAGQLQITTTTAAAYFGMNANEKVSLIGSDVSIELVNVGTLQLNEVQVPLQVEASAGNNIGFVVATTGLTGQYFVASAYNSVGTIAYNSTNHRYLRLRESAGTTYWEASPDRSTWTTIWSVANPITLTDLLIGIVHGNEVITTANTMTVDNLNYLANQLPLRRSLRPSPFKPGRAK